MRMRDLFPEYTGKRSQSERRDYVAGVLVDLIERGEFWLTEVMNQDEAPRQTAGDVIFGHGVSDGSDGGESGRHSTSFYVPDQIKSHKVTLFSRDGKTPVRYVDGTRPVVGVVPGSRRRHKVPQFEDNVIDTKQPRVELPVREAWLVLKRAGEFVAFGATADDQKANWLYSEVNPMESKGRRNAAAG